MAEKTLPPTAQKIDIKIPGSLTGERRVLASSVGGLAIRILEGNRLKGTVIEIPSLGVTINGTNHQAESK